MSHHSRPDAIQRLLGLFESPTYLEIGVDHGDTFRGVRAARKVAVDPKFHFECPRTFADDAPEQFHDVTSDIACGTSWPRRIAVLGITMSKG